MMKSAFLLACGCLLVFWSIAQPPYRLYARPALDSCMAATDTMQPGLQKLFLLQELALNINRNQPAKAMKFARKSQLLASQLNEEVKLSESYRLMGLVYKHSGNFAGSLSNFHKSLEIAERTGSLEQQANVNQTIASLYQTLGRDEEMLEALQKGLQFANLSGNDFFIGRLSSSFGGYYARKGDLEKALTSYNTAIAHFRVAPNLRYIAMTLVSTGKLNIRLGKHDLGEQNIAEARAIQSRISNPNGVGFADLALSIMKLELGQLNEMKKHQDNAWRVFKKLTNNRGMAFVTLNRTRLLLKKKDFAGASKQAKECELYVTLWPTDSQTRHHYRRLSLFFSEAGRYEEAFYYASLHLEVQEKLLGDEIGKRVAEMERKRINQQKNQEIIVVEQAKQKAEFQMEQERKQKDQFLLFAMLFLLMVVVVVYAYFKVRRVNVLLGEKNAIIQNDLEVRGNLLRELHHRVKNNLQIVDGFFGLQERKVAQEDARTIIREGRNRLRSMSILHGELYKEGSPTDIQLHQYLTNLGNHLCKSLLADRSNIRFSMDLDPMTRDADFAVNIGLIVNELLTNAIKYAFPNGNTGSIDVLLKKGSDGIVLTVKDDGIGLPNDSLQLHTSGLSLVRNFSRKIGGELSIHNESGTEFRLYVPESV